MGSLYGDISLRGLKLRTGVRKWQEERVSFLFK